MMKKNICLVVAYDGTDFHGFQRQTNAESIQGCIEQGLSAIFQTPITIYGAARTDAGVHARGQVVNFYGQESIPTEKDSLCHERLSAAGNCRPVGPGNAQSLQRPPR